MADTSRPTVVILTALPVESEAVRAHLTNTEWLVHPSGTRMECGRLPGTSWYVALAEIGEGTLTAASLTERVNSWLAPQALFFVGVAGGLKDDINIGDVVVATKVYGIHGGKQTPEGLLARPEAWRASHRLEQAARQALGRTDSRTHFKPIAVGDVVLADADSPIARYIHKNFNDAAAIEMEGAGVAQAAHLIGTLQTLIIRGISDKADPDKSKRDTEGSQPLAAHNAAVAAIAVLHVLKPTGAVDSALRQQRLDLVRRQAQASRRVRLSPVPADRRDAVLEWMAEHPEPAVVPEGEVRVLVGPMGAGKSERAGRWLEEGLEAAELDDEVEIPVWLEARKVTGSLSATVTEAIGGAPIRPCRVVIDDLSSLAPGQADQLLDEARHLVLVWPRVQVLATSREGVRVAREECLTADAWPRERGADLLRCVLGAEVPPAACTPEARKLMTSPLLVIAMAARITGGKQIDTSPLQLLSGLARDIIDRERRPQTNDQTWDRLAQLATRILTSLEPVPAALFATDPQVWALTDTDLVVDDEAGLRFTLPLFEQYFAAQALRSDMVALEEAAGAHAFPSWRYALAFAVSTVPEETGEEWMLRLARANPAAASWILDEITRPRRPFVYRDTPEEGTESSLKAGAQLREAVQAFLTGFDACGPQLAHHHHGRLVQWGVRLRGHGGMILCEAREATQPELVPLPDIPLDGARAAGWQSGTAFELPSGHLERWRWARDRLSEPLARLLHQRRLPLPPGSPLEGERIWSLAQQIMKFRHQQWAEPVIPLADLRAAVAQMMSRVNASQMFRQASGRAEVDSHDIRWIDDRLTGLHGEHLGPQRLLPDRRSSANRQRWQDYSPDLTVSILTEVLRDAVVGYRDLVSENFPRFGSALGLRSVLPVRVEGQVITREDGPEGSCLYYTLTPDLDSPLDAVPQVSLTLAEAPQPLRDETGLMEGGNAQTVFHRTSDHMISLPTGDPRPATNIAYNWLADDLRALGWFRQRLRFSE
ncbi:hypothetical protein [Streptomyces sp. NPDC058371]|uniref:phosphorylase family protein n=1 Tax=Streptomyces sp. NPDC058371 TaxID=3346463 RepID=UPI00366071A6